MKDEMFYSINWKYRKGYDDAMADKWIPVSERVPEEDVMVLVTAQPKNGEPNVNRAYFANGSWHGSGSMSGVVAWMPLPKPYQEDKNEDTHR